MFPRNQLQALATDPGSPEAATLSEEIADALRALKPTIHEMEEIRNFIPLLASVGLAKEALPLVERWQHIAPNLAEEMRVLFSLTEYPAAAAYALELRSEDPKWAAVRVMNHFFRGTFETARKLAAEDAWFLDEIEALDGIVYAFLALILDDLFDEARALLQEWRDRHFGINPESDIMLCRCEATLHAYTCDFQSELAAIEEAVMFVTASKLKSLAAGRMGYSTSEVGDLVAEKVAE